MNKDRQAQDAIEQREPTTNDKIDKNPEGPHARERRFVAFGWPSRLEAGQKIFCIDQDEQIWESPNPQGFAGCESGPPRGICPEGDAADGWVRWRNKTNKLSVGAK